MELVLAPILAVVVVLATAFEAIGIRGQGTRDALDEVARRHGLQHQRGTWLRAGTARGIVDDLEVVIDALGMDGGPSGGTRVTVRHPALATLGFAIAPRGKRRELSNGRGASPDVEVGDHELDAVAVVRGSPAALYSTLGPKERESVRALVRSGGVLANGACTIVAAGVVSDAAALDEWVRIAIGAAKRLVDAERESVDALCGRAETDPVPEVRHRALEEAVRLGAPDAWLDRMSRTDEPTVILLAARARGEAGRERLWALVERGHGAWPRRAAVALAQLPPDARRADLEDVLLRCLEDRADLKVTDALARIGSVRSVPLLRARGGEAAERAVRDIQGRAVGANGGLSLTDGRGGELAEVSDGAQEGRLSASAGRAAGGRAP